MEFDEYQWKSKEMNRKHTREEYLNIITELKQARPEIKFSSDFIVGYPGETEKDFNDTISFGQTILDYQVHSVFLK